MVRTTFTQGAHQAYTILASDYDTFKLPEQGGFVALDMIDHVGKHFQNAIATISKILMDAQGNATVRAYGRDTGVIGATGDGNDRVDFDVPIVHWFRAGGGDDTLKIRTHAMSDPRLADYQHVNFVDGGDGNDTIDIDAANWVTGIYGGGGDDVITIKTGRAHAVVGGDGDDKISVSALEVNRASGDDGNDEIVIEAERAHRIWGGAGRDTIRVTAAEITQVDGGSGDDHIVLNNTSGGVSEIVFDRGDGHDVIETNSALRIVGRGYDKPLNMAEAKFSRDGDIVTVAFDGSRDSLTIKLTGDLADTDVIAVSRDSATGAIVIGRAAGDAAGGTMLALLR